MKSVCIICACLLFVAIFRLPIEYYRILRAIVFIGAVVVIFNKSKQFYWVVIFTLIAILFNPIYPTYLYRKLIWMPLDIITGILFLMAAFFNYSKKDQKMKVEKTQKKYERDRISK